MTRQRTHRRRTASDNAPAFDAPEVWHEPGDHESGDGDATRFIEQPPGDGYLHPVTIEEVRDRIADLPERFTDDLEVVQLSRMTRKRRLFPCYGMQWGPAVYLYPLEASLVEYYVRPPSPQQRIETKMFGGRWSRENGMWMLSWTAQTIRDFYLHNVLIHEIGHLNDARNRSFRDRERYADWFAIEYGYRAWRGRS